MAHRLERAIIERQRRGARNDDAASLLQLIRGRALERHAQTCEWKVNEGRVAAGHLCQKQRRPPRSRTYIEQPFARAKLEKLGDARCFGPRCPTRAPVIAAENAAFQLAQHGGAAKLVVTREIRFSHFQSKRGEAGSGK